MNYKHNLSNLLGAFPVDYRDGASNEYQIDQLKNKENIYPHIDMTKRYLAKISEIQRIKKHLKLDTLIIEKALKEFTGMPEVELLEEAKSKAEEIGVTAFYVGGVLRKIDGVRKPSIDEVNSRIANKEEIRQEDNLVLIEQLIKLQNGFMSQTVAALLKRRTGSFKLSVTAGLCYIPLNIEYAYVMDDLFDGVDSDSPDYVDSFYAYNQGKYFELTRKHHHIRDFKY